MRELTDAEAAEVQRASADREEISRLRAEVAELKKRLDLATLRESDETGLRHQISALQQRRDELAGALSRKQAEVTSLEERLAEAAEYIASLQARYIP